MAKILVADDNSNVQKTVALALADLGVEVIAVNNGEAAVRKIPDSFPDLVLADIFMPVRNGYEVCEFVKKDSRFSKIPVVLLVGAFDPLDEREAQRVGADGILKKPFVPPEPLITMVKTLLERSAGERLVSVGAPAAPVAVHAAARPAPSPKVFAPEPEPEAIPPVQDFPPAPAKISFGKADAPVAFQSMFEAPVSDAARANSNTVAEPVDDATILTCKRDANLGEPVFWRDELEPEGDAEPKEEPAEAEESAADLGTHNWGPEKARARAEEAAMLRAIERTEAAEPVKPPPATAPPQPVLPSQPVEAAPPNDPLELVREEQQESGASMVDPVHVQLDPAMQMPLTVSPGRAPELAATPLDWMASIPSPPSHATQEEIAPTDEALEEETPAASALVADSAPPAASELVPMHAATTDEADATKRVADAAPPPDPDLVVASGLHEIAPASANPLEAESTPAAPTLSDSKLSAAEIPPANAQAWAAITAQVQAEARNLALASADAAKPAHGSNDATPASSGAAHAPEESAAKSPDPALVEAVVSRILDRMQPQMMDIVTKEFLRPIVQALVNRELDKR